MLSWFLKRLKKRKDHLRLFEVDVARLFPPDNPQSVPLLQFMAAVNDTITAQLYFLGVGEANGSVAEGLVVAAKRNYFFRLACGHLYEGLCAFRQAERANALRTMVERMPPEGRQAYETLLAAADPDNADTFWYRVLRPIRTAGIFHYLTETFRDALLEYPQGLRNHLVLAPIHGDSRFILTDNLISRTVLIPVIGPEDSDEARQAVRQVASLQGALARFCHWFLAVLVEERRDAIKEVAKLNTYW